jgi:hypothetical protein
MDVDRPTRRILEDVQDLLRRPGTLHADFAREKITPEREQYLLAVATAFLTTPMH